MDHVPVCEQQGRTALAGNSAYLVRVCKSSIPARKSQACQKAGMGLQAKKYAAQKALHCALAGSGSGSGNIGGGSNLGGGGSGAGGGGNFEGGGLPQRLAYGFAILIALGGYMGYRKKGSRASLKASGGFAAALLVAGYLIGGPFASAGLGIALVANLALGGYMAKGFAATKKPFPQGVFSVVSALNSIIYIKALTGS